MAGKPQVVTTITATPLDEGLRLDTFVAKSIPGLSRAKAQQLIAEGLVQRTVGEGAQSTAKPLRGKDPVLLGDTFAVSTAPVAVSPLVPVAMALAILFEDEHMLVINKPAGLTVHPGAGTIEPTLVHGLLHYAGASLSQAHLLPSPQSAGHVRSGHQAYRPGIVHRLDKDTSGVMVVAKTDAAHAALAQQFHDKTQLVREYAAILDGVLPEADVVQRSYLHRDPLQRLRFTSATKAAYDQVVAERPLQARGYRFAKSAFRRTAVYGNRLTLARVRLFTGRTHQIRVHARDLGAPVLGDMVYHRPVQLPQTFPAPVRKLLQTLTRQMLHAQTLGLKHPATGEPMLFEAPYPDDLRTVIAALQPFS